MTAEALAKEVDRHSPAKRVTKEVQTSLPLRRIICSASAPIAFIFGVRAARRRFLPRSAGFLTRNTPPSAGEDTHATFLPPVH
ncbi:MAG: hypothetical protein L3J39_06435 [Verrucomicrobiales bacterium]|nr:hypothetical protein [Verrucomicrobiales bacterium]